MIFDIAVHNSWGMVSKTKCDYKHDVKKVTKSYQPRGVYKTVYWPLLAFSAFRASRGSQVATSAELEQYQAWPA